MLKKIMTRWGLIMKKSVAKNNRDVRKNNKNGIIALLRDFGSLTKADIAGKMNLTFTAVNNLVDDLMKDRYIVEAGYLDDSSRGRKPMLISLNPGGLYTIGVHISATSIRTAVINLQGKPIIKRTQILKNTLDSEAVIAEILSEIHTILDESGVKSEIIGIGVGAPGPLDPDQGIVLSPPNLPGLQGVSLQNIIEESVHIPVKIEKDANAMAIGELWYGNGRQHNNVLFVDADIGIGSGLIFDQQIYQGHPYGAGEIGHGTIDLDGPRCNCGNYGCLEAVASGMAIVRRVGEELRRGAVSSLEPVFNKGTELQVMDVIQAALDHDDLAEKVLNESARYIGISLANVINLLTPEMIIIGGVLPNYDLNYFQNAKEIALSRCLAVFKDKTLLMPSQLGEHAGVIGAGTVSLAKYINESII